MLEVNDKQVKVLWENTNLCNQFSSLVHKGGYIYGVSGNANSRASFVCIDAKDGKLIWSEKLGFGNFMVADNKVIFSSERGKLHIFELNPKAYIEISSAQTKLEKLVWGPPILCRGLIYSRSTNGLLICLDVGN